MEMFLDSARVDEIRSAIEAWDIDGVTTNPRHVRDAGQPLDATLAQIADLVSGTELPVSVEVDPRLTDQRAMIEAGRALAARSPNFVVKIGASEAGFRALRALADEGIRTNCTLVFSVAQAWHAARSGATYVSPFVGWREAHGDDAEQLIPEIAAMLETHGYPTQIIAAALRNARQLAAAALSGAHCATAGVGVWQESFRNPYSDMGHEIFGAAWDATPGNRGQDA